MEEKESNNINNKTSFPIKDKHNRYDCNHSKSFSLERISKVINIHDSSDYFYSWLGEDDPYFIQVPIDPKLQELGIEDMALFAGNMIFKTKIGTVVLFKDNMGFLELLLPTQKQSREDAIELSETTHRILNSPMLMSSLEERMNSEPTMFRSKHSE